MLLAVLFLVVERGPVTRTSEMLGDELSGSGFWLLTGFVESSRSTTNHLISSRKLNTLNKPLVVPAGTAICVFLSVTVFL